MALIDWNKLLIFLSVLIIIQFLIAGCSDVPPADNFIHVKRVSKNVILVRMGVDYFESIAAIKTKEGIIVIDAGTSHTLTKKYRKVIEEEFNSDNFRYLINTHHHFDHTGGNGAFPDAEIIAHETCLEEMKKSAQDISRLAERFEEIVDQLNMELDKLDRDTAEWSQTLSRKYRYSSALYDLKNEYEMQYPAKTFSQSEILFIGDMTCKLYYFGNAHSLSDILIYIPEEKILFTGDLFFNGGRPSIYNYPKEDVERWNSLLSSLINEEAINTIIQGHGIILDRDDLIGFKEIILERAEK